MPRPDPSSVRIDGPWQHRDVHANGIRFHLAETGPSDPAAPLAVLLHGFPGMWWSWRHQLTGLAQQGIRTVAVDLRGYGDSDKPPRGYDGWTLAGDIAGLIRALGHSQATLVGHADGGLVCWSTALLHPRLVRSIALVSSPHPIGLRAATLRDRDQRKALLSPMAGYQLPWWPERRLTRNDGAEVERLLRTRSGPRWSADPEFAEVTRRLRSAMQIPGTAHCALEYQRWAFRSQLRGDGRRFMGLMKKTLQIPAVQIHGAEDPYVLTKTILRDVAWAPNRSLITVPGAGHYAHEEAPRIVTSALAKFITGSS